MSRKITITVSPVYLQAVERMIGELQRDGWDVSYLGRPDEQLGQDELCDLLRDAEVYIVGNARVPRVVIERSPGLSLICKYGVGVDNIDLPAARERRIQVTNVPGGNAISVAEMTIGALIALSRRLKQAEALLRDGGWRVTVGEELYERTLGIIGLGRIGKQVAMRARAFGMRVLSNDIVEYPEFCREFRVEPVGLERLLRESHAVTLHVPLTPLTRHMIAEEQFALMRPGAVLIHTARGGVVDEPALVGALSGGRLAGAAIDVFEREPLGASPLRSLDHVILTPHIAGITAQAAQRIADRTIESVRSYQAGRALAALVT